MGHVKGGADNSRRRAPQRRLIAASRRTMEGPIMPYRTNEELPESVSRHLPPHAQDIYRAAFNHAFAAHAGDPRQEEAAHRIAWAAVKRSYVKIGKNWVERNNTC
jgi:cation transport regulator